MDGLIFDDRNKANFKTQNSADVRFLCEKMIHPENGQGTILYDKTA